MFTSSRPFSDELKDLIAAFDERPVRVRDVLEVTQNRGYIVLLVLLSFPFCTPIPVPGFSTPFGAVMALVGLRLALGRKPWLPSRLLEMRLPRRFFPRLLAATRRPVKWLEAILQPRLCGLVRSRVARCGMGTMICASGVLLMLPLPIPFSNCLPALTVLFLALALLEEDGYFAVSGAFMFLLTLGFFALLGWGGAEVIRFIREMFGV